jgi:hypothetical protein
MGVHARWVNGWHLFAVTSATITAFMLARLLSTNFSSPQDLSAMIQYSAALGGTFHLSGYRDFCPLSIVS